ncbi:sphingosine-1-phosphate phosphatase 1-like [Ctenocephalides felis]|uniref:sphingosine-1-phosphate phosphatase 1-like n=1 Tax=Ctenocephalides felis TaxID=7515 RepID=UPI000E6E347A|nr:sphingosine-1-phosphate phosphatase 1-like [Ctenocephalides felis]
MNKIKQSVEYLKGPDLVVEVQKYFGVKYKPSVQKNNSDTEYDINRKQIENQQKYTATKNIYEQSDNSQFNDVNLKCHKRNVSTESQSSQCVSTDDASTDSDIELNKPKYEITNKFWYYLFRIGTELGDEIFYATFIPFWFWNIDGAVGRRVIFVWSVIMYIGQGLKDVIRWPRPGPPCIRLQEKWSQEYGMPSTHAMVGIAIPLSVLIFTAERYIYPLHLGGAVTLTWCLLISVSRLYLGMHSALDVIAGLFLALLLMIPLVPLADLLDGFLVTNPMSPLAVLLLSLLLIWKYPSADRWTPTRGDTTMTTSVYVGIVLGAWLNYQLGRMVIPSLPPPYTIIWPSWSMQGLTLLRTTLGLCCIMATRAICKSLSYALVCALIRKDPHELRKSENSLQNRSKLIVELSYKYFTYGMIGFNTVFLLPHVFQLLGINRPTFYTEL